MKYLKTLEGFKQITYNLENLFNQISLYKVADKIYCVVVKDQQLRAFLFLRLQEYYESPEFQGKKFTWDNFMQWYKKIGNKSIFTYGKDWTGFNIPSEVIDHCYQSVEDPNKYDDVMISIVTEIKEKEEGKFYLIGVDELHMDSDLLDHEMAHGFYYTDDKYRLNMQKLVYGLPEDAREYISEVIVDMGYSNTVVNDEIQAYMSTGLSSDMDKELEKYTQPFKDIINRWKKIHYIAPQKIEITFI